MSSSSEPVSIITPYGYSSSTCGYCSPAGQRSVGETSKTYGAVAHILSVQDYKDLIDRGWRRSGTYCYKPDVNASCCPHHTIRLHTDSFSPSKSQRQLVNRFVRFIQEGGKEGEKGFGTRASTSTSTSTPGTSASVKGKGKSTFDLYSTLLSAESITGAHDFTLTLEPSTFTEEKYALYKKYQMSVHGDSESKVSKKGFERFLCDSPLKGANGYGTYHHLYRLDGQLIAFGVLDILPGCVSSVYLVWDPDWSGLALGKLSALREICLVRELSEKGLPMDWYYMGYYIHSCQKMKYKSEYAPSYLLDPATNVFYPFEKCKVLLDQDPRASFAEPSSTSDSHTPSDSSIHSKEAQTSTREADNDARSNMSNDDSDFEDEEEESTFPSPPPPGFLDPHALPTSLLARASVKEGRYRVPLQVRLSCLIRRTELTIGGIVE